MYALTHDIRAFVDANESIAKVLITRVQGSSPRAEGTWMLVSNREIFRTIGGGQLENIAIEKAREKLTKGGPEPLEIRLPLGPNIGQCCGGTVWLKIELIDIQGQDRCVCDIEREMTELPHVYIFGAGHVGRALVKALTLLPLDVTVVDGRKSELDLIQEPVEIKLSVLPEKEIREAPKGSSFVVVTHDHALDFLLASEALSRKDASYVGMIGSSTKRAVFLNWLRREKTGDVCTDGLACPIGGSRVTDKRPEVIAALCVSEILTAIREWEDMQQTSKCHDNVDLQLRVPVL